MVNTLDGTDQIVVPTGTNSDSVIRLARKGSCKLGNKTYRGDHLVHIQVNFFSIFNQTVTQLYLDQTSKVAN